MGGIVKQIIGSFEDIGKDIVRETAKLPTEMLGIGKPKPKLPQNPLNSPTTPKPEPEKPVVPRQWLEELAGKNKQMREPTVQERLARENQEKNEQEAKQAAAAQKMAPIASGSSKPKRGNLYGVKQKASSEMSKNARQD